MIYKFKFKSKAAADVIMLGPQGEQILRLIGREPSPQGILLKDQLAAAIARLEQAVSEDEARFTQAVVDAEAAGEPAPRRAEVSLKQRAWPFVELLRYSLAAGQDVVWGV